MANKSKSRDEINEESNESIKKLLTKDMVREALGTSDSKKGISLQAIKKYIKETYDVDIIKINNLINRSLKNEVEKGTIIQTKGVGASGSFKLNVVKSKEASKKNKNDKKSSKDNSLKDKSKHLNNSKKKNDEKSSPEIAKKSRSLNKTTEKIKTKHVEKPAKKVDAPQKLKKKLEVIVVKDDKYKLGPLKIVNTPIKKVAKRKSIGNIIKPPKMKPKFK